MSSTPLIASSSGVATVSAITFGLAPGYTVRTTTDGGTTFGYSPIGSSGIERAEEHTSELQSLMRISYAVFCLKKKTQRTHSSKTRLTKLQTNAQNNKNV